MFENGKIFDLKKGGGEIIKKYDLFACPKLPRRRRVPDWWLPLKINFGEITADIRTFPRRVDWRHGRASPVMASAQNPTVRGRVDTGLCLGTTGGATFP